MGVSQPEQLREWFETRLRLKLHIKSQSKQQPVTLHREHRAPGRCAPHTVLSEPARNVLILVSSVSANSGVAGVTWAGWADDLQYANIPSDVSTAHA